LMQEERGGGAGHDSGGRDCGAADALHVRATSGADDDKAAA